MSDEIRSGERANNFLLTISSNYLYCLYYLFGIIIALILSYHSMAGIIITVPHMMRNALRIFRSLRLATVTEGISSMAWHLHPRHLDTSNTPRFALALLCAAAYPGRSLPGTVDYYCRTCRPVRAAATAGNGDNDRPAGATLIIIPFTGRVQLQLQLQLYLAASASGSRLKWPRLMGTQHL
jgi:hypothetical protein